MWDIREMITPNAHRFINQIKADAINEFKCNFAKRLHSCEKVQSFEKAVILPVRKGEFRNHDFGGVLRRDGTLVEDSLIPGWITGWYDDYDQLVYSKRAVVYCGRMIGHWGHFLLETITRLWFYLKYDTPELLYVFTVSEGSEAEIEGNFKLFFDLLGLGNRILYLNQATQFDYVIVPERSFQFKRFYSKQYIEVLDKVIVRAIELQKRSLYNKRIYLSRGQFSRALESEVGLDLIDNFFKKNGYEVLYPEQLSLIELINALFYASECASESGTAAHNFLFCNQSQHTYVFERQPAINEAQVSIEVSRHLNSIYIDAFLPLMRKNEPSFLYYSEHMKRFAISRGMLPPDDKYLCCEKKIEYCRIFKTLYNKMYITPLSNDDYVRILQALDAESGDKP